MTSGTYYRLRDGYRTLVVDRRIPESMVVDLDTSKVAIVERAVRLREVKVEEAISDVQVLSKSDLRHKYHPPAEPDHPVPSTGGDSAQPNDEGIFDDDVLSEHEPTVDSEPDLDEADYDEGETEELVMVPRWLVEAVVEKYDGSRRMSQAWLDAFKTALEAEVVYVDD
jgi:hypothetical protein